jgi:hypothetical protein
MNGALKEQMRALATSGTRVAGLLQKPALLVCGVMIEFKTFDVGTSRRTFFFDSGLDTSCFALRGDQQWGL